MNRTFILPAIAIILLAIFTGPTLLLLLLLLPIAGFFIKRKEEDNKSEAVIHQSIEEVTQTYGEPDDVVVLNASKANEIGSLLLFYTSRDMVIVCGRELKLSDLVSVAPKNMSTPYTIDEFAVVLTTNCPDCSTIKLRVGYDAGLASDIACQIDAHIGTHH